MENKIRKQATDEGKYEEIMDSESNMEKKLQQVVIQFNITILKQKNDLNNFKQELDIQNTTLDLIAKQVRNQMQEVQAMQNYQIELIDTKFTELKKSIDEKNLCEIEQLKQSISDYMEVFGQTPDSSGQKHMEKNHYDQIMTKLANLERQLQALHKRFEKDNTQKAEDIFLLVKEDPNYQAVLTKIFKKDTAEQVEASLNPFKVLTETRTQITSQNIQTFALAIRKCERLVKENTDNVEILKREIELVSQNMGNRLSTLINDIDLDMINRLTKDNNEQINDLTEQIDEMYDEINAMKQELEEYGKKNDQHSFQLEQFKDITKKQPRKSIRLDNFERRGSRFDTNLNQTTPINLGQKKDKDGIIQKPVHIDPFLSHNNSPDYIAGRSSNLESKKEPILSMDYLSQVEIEIKRIYKQIKFLKIQENEKQNSKAVRYRRVELYPKHAELKYNSVDQNKTGSPIFNSLRTLAKQWGLKHEQFRSHNHQKDLSFVFNQTQKENNVSPEKNKQQTVQKSLNQSKLYQDIISDEILYQRYRAQVDEISDKCLPKAEQFYVKNPYKHHSPFTKIRDPDNKFNSNNLTNNLFVKSDEIPSSNQRSRQKQPIKQLQNQTYNPDSFTKKPPEN